MMALFTLIGATALAGSPRSQVQAALTGFTEAVAAGDAARARTFLHPDAVQVVQMPTGPATLGTEAYLGMVEAGKVGGNAISLEVEDLRVSGPVATATTVRRTGGLELTDAVSLFEGASGWQIVGMAVAVRSVEAE
jgi:ketosteroid isomerase-like protein